MRRFTSIDGLTLGHVPSSAAMTCYCEVRARPSLLVDPRIERAVFSLRYHERRGYYGQHAPSYEGESAAFARVSAAVAAGLSLDALETCTAAGWRAVEAALAASGAT